MTTCVIASGYFDPIHTGHLEYLAKARRLGDYLVVIVNSDKQATAKKGKPFMSEETRGRIVRDLRYVDAIVIATDEDETVRSTIRNIWRSQNDRFDRFIFAKGGDRSATNVPEVATCVELNIDFVDGLGEKCDSSKRYYSNNA